MTFNRTITYGVIVFMLLLSAAPTNGQGPGGFQIFGLADVSTYGGNQKPNEGYFFQFDGLYWSITPPETHPVGYPGTRTVYYGIHPTSPLDTESDARIQSNTLDTSVFDNQFRAGNRIEFGRIENRNGWLVSIFQLRDEIQNYEADGADMVFNDPAFGPYGERLLYGNVNNNSSSTPPYSPPVFSDLPLTFYDILLQKKIDTWGVETSYLHRFRTRHGGGTLEMFFGARYFEFNENFWVTTGSTLAGTADTGAFSYLQNSSWNSDTENHIVGPQIGLRWFKKRGRWMVSTEGRFLAGLNCQNIHMQADIGPSLTDPGANPDGSYDPFVPKTMTSTSSTHAVYEREWSPAVELRVEGRYQVTRSISVHAGWSGMWIDGVARASSVIDYTVPSMGINLAHNQEDVFLNGLTLGFDVNR
ncbi:MAG: BBP7 family outer membrane beta-barrel protein [Pirellulales bacterium]|nr:BBP7 family outer membrane beta-barrel protein [Pirellulales bacterium]